MADIRTQYGLPLVFTFIGESFVYGAGRMVIGGAGHMNRGCIVQLWRDCTLTLGRNVRIGPYVCFYTQTQTGNQDMDRPARALRTRTGNIVIGDGVWIGAHCTLLPGVVMGDNSVLAANSLLGGRVPENAIWAGVPARHTRFKALPGG